MQYGFEDNANLVGAINILAAEHAALTCGGTALSGRPAKQEPKRLRRSLLLFSAVGIAFLQVGEDVKTEHLECVSTVSSNNSPWCETLKGSHDESRR